MHIAGQFIEFVKRPKSGLRNTFEQHAHGIAPMGKGFEHLLLRGIFHPGHVLWPDRVGNATIRDERDHVDQSALFDREGQDMCIQAEVHLRDVDQVFVDVSGLVGSPKLLTVDHPAVGAGTTEPGGGQGLGKPLKHVVTNTGFDTVSRDQQVAFMGGTICEVDTDTLVLLLNPRSTLVKVRDARWQTRS